MSDEHSESQGRGDSLRQGLDSQSHSESQGRGGSQRQGLDSQSHSESQGRGGNQRQGLDSQSHSESQGRGGNQRHGADKGLENIEEHAGNKPFVGGLGIGGPKLLQETSAAQCQEVELGSYVLACSHDGDVGCFEAGSGACVWHTQLPTRAEAGLVVTQGLEYVVVACGDGLQCLRFATGTFRTRGTVLCFGGLRGWAAMPAFCHRYVSHARDGLVFGGLREWATMPVFCHRYVLHARDDLVFW